LSLIDRAQATFTPRSTFVKLSIGLHVLALLFVVAAPSYWKSVVAVVVVDHLVLAWGSLWPRSSLVGPNLRRLREAEASNVVGLTFDDGPDPEVTPKVLKILDERGARATFFCIGVRAEENPRLVAEISSRGHRVENHSTHHRKTFCFLGPSALVREIDRTQNAIRRSVGYSPCYFRAPAGLRSPWLDFVLVSRGLELVSWSRRGFDTVSRDSARIVRRLVRNIRSGDIIVLHDGSSARDDRGSPVVLEALPVVLDELERRGLRAVAIPTTEEI
jgi:peptidoglycan/xylan/chitin deacetylase (PgdA/CDA1 family)